MVCMGFCLGAFVPKEEQPSQLDSKQLRGIPPSFKQRKAWVANHGLAPFGSAYSMRTYESRNRWPILRMLIQ